MDVHGYIVAPCHHTFERKEGGVPKRKSREIVTYIDDPLNDSNTNLVCVMYEYGEERFISSCQHAVCGKPNVDDGNGNIPCIPHQLDLYRQHAPQQRVCCCSREQEHEEKARVAFRSQRQSGL